MNYPGPQQPYPPQPPFPPQPPGNPQFRGYPVRPPKRGLGAGTIVLIVLAVLVAVCGLGGLLALGGSKTAAPTSNDTGAAVAAPAGRPAVTAAAPQAHPTPGPNTPVRDGKFEFTVTAVQSGIATVGDNPFLRKTAQGAYTIVSITVRNTSNVPYGFSPSDQYVFDSQNRKFGNDSAAAMNLQADTSLYASINPGNTITAQVVFDLPADAAADHIVLHDSMFSGGTAVSLKQ